MTLATKLKILVYVHWCIMLGCLGIMAFIFKCVLKSAILYYNVLQAVHLQFWEPNGVTMSTVYSITFVKKKKKKKIVQYLSSDMFI